MTNEKPTLNLTPLENTVVHTPKFEDWKTLLRACEIGGWRWVIRTPPTENINSWGTYEERTCLSAGCSIGENLDEENSGRLWYSPIDSYSIKGAKIISLQEFCDKEGITDEDLSKVNRYFESQKDRR
jgi:hypothetical protein